MASIITHQLRKAIAEAIYDDIFSRRNNYYYFFGRYLDSETVPFEPETSLEYEQTVRNHIVAAKKIYISDVSYVVPRFNWTSGVAYEKYNTLLDGIVTEADGPQFYVYDDVNYRVYKCIDNNNGGMSTVRPFSTDAFDVTYDDGYVWRYLYSLPTSIRTKFLTTTHLPVFTAHQNRYYSDGGIGDITIVKSGSNYTQSTSIIDVFGDGTGAVLEPVIVNGQLGDIIVKNPGRDYTTAVISITDSGNGSGAAAVVELNAGDLDSDQALVELLTVPGTVDTAEVLSPGSGYLSATVKVIGDGTGATAEAVIVGETIDKIIINNKGEGYSWASLIITPQANPAITSEATTRVNVSPYRGHGKNAVDELFADQLMLYSNISSNRLADFDVVSPYAQFGIIKNISNLDYTPNIYDQVSPSRYQIEADFGPQVTFIGGGGIGARGRVNVTGNFVSDVLIESAGDGYSSAPLVSFGEAYPTITVSRTATTATATFAAKLVAPYPIGSSIVVAGVTPSSFNGTFTVTACTTTSVSWADTNGATTATVQGTVITSGSGATAVTTLSAILEENTAVLSYGGVGYASAPGVTVSSVSGSGGSIVATTSLGVGAVVINSRGSGYTSAPTVNFVGGTISGVAATATAVISGGKLVKIIVTNPGQYTVLPTVNVSGGTGGTGASVISTPIETYTTATLTVDKPGSGYEIPPSLVFNGSSGISDIVVNNPGILFTAGVNPAIEIKGGGGNGCTATTYVDNCVNSVTISNSGSGYTVAPLVTFSGAGGSGATGTAVISGGKVVDIIITNRGSGYTTANVSFSATPWSASTAVTLNQELFVSDSTSNRRYIVSVAGTTSTTAPTHTIDSATNGTATLVYVGILATATATAGIGITHINITNPGTGYTSIPTVYLVDNNGTQTDYELTPVLGTATGSVAISGYVKSVSLTSNGTGYTSAPAVVLTGGSPVTQAVLYSEVVGEVSSITIDEGGSGYTSRPTVTISGGGGIGASYAANIDTITNKVTSCTKLVGGSDYVTTKFANFAVGTILVDDQLNEFTVHSAKTNLKNDSLIVTSNNNQSAVYANMKLRKKNASDYFITNNSLSQKFLESRFPVACYVVRGKFSLLNFIAGTSLTLTDQTNGNKTFIIISAQAYDTSTNEMLLLPIDGGKLNTGATLSNGTYSFSILSLNNPALDRRTGEVLMISNNYSSFTQNSDQTLSFRTIINF